GQRPGGHDAGRRDVDRGAAAAGHARAGAGARVCDVSAEAAARFLAPLQEHPARYARTSPGGFAVSAEHYETLRGRLAARTARVGVVGLGYVGLPLAVEFARAEFVTTGIDLDAR